jgi:hypothetical protein
MQFNIPTQLFDMVMSFKYLDLDENKFSKISLYMVIGEGEKKELKLAQTFTPTPISKKDVFSDEYQLYIPTTQIQHILVFEREPPFFLKNITIFFKCLALQSVKRESFNSKIKAIFETMKQQQEASAAPPAPKLEPIPEMTTTSTMKPLEVKPVTVKTAEPRPIPKQAPKPMTPSKSGPTIEELLS